MEVMKWKKDYLDYVLVPTGLFFMFGYHLLHLHRCINLPQTTLIGYENYHKNLWVRRILQLENKDRGQAVAVIGSNISAATSLASICLALSSLIGAWIGNSDRDDVITRNIYGNTSPTLVYVKYMSLLSCFIFAFACFFQTVRSFVHANFLISMPNCEIPVADVQAAVVKGSNFWVVGLRSLYFATNLLLWIFGPIPMFVCSVIMVAMLQYFDKNSSPFPSYRSLVQSDDRYTSAKKTGQEMSEIEAPEGPNGTPNVRSIKA